MFLEEPLDDADGREGPGTTSEDGERGAGDLEVVHAAETEVEVRENDAAEMMNGACKRTGGDDVEGAEMTEPDAAVRRRIAGLQIELETAAEWNTFLIEEAKVLSEKVRVERDKNQECVRELERELERVTQHNADLKEEVGV